MGAANGIKKEIILNSSEDFTIVIHVCPNNCDTESRFQWFVTKDTNSPVSHEILGMTEESITLSSEVIRKEFRNKWIFCRCSFPDQEYLEGCVYLTDDFVGMIRHNQFDTINFFGNDGIIREDISYEKSYDYYEEIMRCYQKFADEMFANYEKCDDKEKGEFYFELRRFSKKEPFWCVLACDKNKNSKKIYGHCCITNKSIGNMHRLLSIFVNKGCKCRIEEGYFMETELYGM